MRFASLLALLGLAAFSCVASARAQDAPKARLSWVRGEGADGCIDGQALSRDVVRRLRRDPFVEPAAQIIEGYVARDGERFVARIYARDASTGQTGSRVIESEGADCRTLDAALGLAIALVIDPDAALAPAPAPAPEPEPAPAPAPAPAPTPAPTSEPAPEPAAALASPDPDRIAPAASIGMVIALDLVPGWSFGIERSTDAPLIGPLRWHLGFLFLPETRTQAPDPVFGFTLTTGLAGLCLASRLGALFAFQGCLDGMFGAITAVVYSPSPLDPGARGWGGIRANAALAFEPVEFGYLSVEIAAVVPFLRYEFRVAGHEEVVFKQPAVAPTLFLGGGVRFP